MKRRSAEFGAAMRRGAERRRCPACGRKSALTWVSDDFGVGQYCRWEDCDYERITPNEALLEVVVKIGTCQSCGAYWDVTQYTACPSCGGYIG